MNNRNDTKGADREAEDPDQSAQKVSNSATGMFQQPLIPAEGSSFEDLAAEFRITTPCESGAQPTSVSCRAASETPVPSRAEISLAAANASPSPLEEKASSGEFTQFFRAMTPTAAAEVRSPHRPPAPTEPEQLAAEQLAAQAGSIEQQGEFTRIFMQLPKAQNVPPLAPAPMPPLGGRPHVPENPQEAEPGEFTRMMRTAESMGGAPKSGSAPVGDRAVPPSSPVRGFSAPGENDAVFGTAGVTGFSVSPVGKPGAASALPPLAPVGESAPANAEGAGSDHSSAPFFHSVGPSEDLPMSGRPARQEQSAGGFTQLFRALDESQEPASTAMRMDAQRPTPPPGGQQTAQPLDAEPGEFTRLMQSLSKEDLGKTQADVVEREVPASGVRPNPMASSSPMQAASGPGDFTRIVSTSRAREEAADAEKLTRDALKSPSTTPTPRAPSLAFGVQAAQPLMVPSTSPPQAPAASSQSRLQAYLPVLLVINAFVLAVLILLVIFALRRH